MATPPVAAATVDATRTPILAALRNAGEAKASSVTNNDIAEALTRIDFKVQKSQVRLPNGPLKTVGEHTVTVAPHSDVVAEVKVVVVGETD